MGQLITRITSNTELQLLILTWLIHLLLKFVLRKESQSWPFRIKAQTVKTWCGSHRKGGGGLGTAVCNHASTFSSIHRGIQATQTAINRHQIRDSLYVCVGTNVLGLRGHEQTHKSIFSCMCRFQWLWSVYFLCFFLSYSIIDSLPFNKCTVCYHHLSLESKRVFHYFKLLWYILFHSEMKCPASFLFTPPLLCF